MKRALWALVFFGTMAGQPVHGENLSGKVELSVAGGLQAFVGDEETTLLLNIPLRVGFFASRSILLEAEGIFSVLDEDLTGDDTEVGYIGSANFSYHLDAGDQMMPFLLVGFGLSNTMPFTGTFAPGELYEDMTFTVLNAGVGLKVMVGTGRHFELNIDFNASAVKKRDGVGVVHIVET